MTVLFFLGNQWKNYFFLWDLKGIVLGQNTKYPFQAKFYVCTTSNLVYMRKRRRKMITIAIEFQHFVLGPLIITAYLQALLWVDGPTGDCL